MECNGGIEGSSGKGGRVGLVFDGRMCRHYAPDGELHPECPDRIRVIWDRLNSSALAKRSFLLTQPNCVCFFQLCFVLCLLFI